MWSIRAHGEVDIHRSELLSAQLDAVIDQGALLVMLDLDGVTFLDSSGLRVIARAGERLRERDGQLLIEGASGAVARVLEITGLLEHYAVGSD
jgi:anti-anti-sigma factor